MGRQRGRLRRRIHHYSGKPLFDILRDLPNNGVGRLIKRGSHQNGDPLTPTYMRILKADLPSRESGSDNGLSRNQTQINKNNRVQVLVEKTWRGVTHPRTVNISGTSYLPDFILIPKEEEEKYLQNSKTPKNYVHWTHCQLKRIKERISQGMSIKEAKERENISITKSDTEGGNVQQGDLLDNSDTAYFDNFDEEENEEQSDEFTDTEDVNEESEQEKTECLKSANQSLEKTCIRNVSKRERRNRDLPSPDGDFNNFTEEQQQRIDKMIQQGVQPDTAKQLELERQIGLMSAAMGGSKAAERRYCTKRKWSQTSNERKYNREKAYRFH